MPSKAGSSKDTNSSGQILVRERVTRGATILQQCKVPTTPPMCTVSPTPSVCTAPWAPIIPDFLFTAPLRPEEPPDPHPVLDFILSEMRKNSKSMLVQWLRSLKTEGSRIYSLPSNRVAFLLLRYGSFAWIEAPAQYGSFKIPQEIRDTLGFSSWDLKPDIAAKWGYGQLVSFKSIGKKGKARFFYDVWGNIHYGYIGRAAGFSASELIWAGDVTNKAIHKGTPDPSSDASAIRIGVDLHKAEDLSLAGLLKRLHDRRCELFRWDPERGKTYNTCDYDVSN